MSPFLRRLVLHPVRTTFVFFFLALLAYAVFRILFPPQYNELEEVWHPVAPSKEVSEGEALSPLPIFDDTAVSNPRDDELLDPVQAEPLALNIQRIVMTDGSGNIRIYSEPMNGARSDIVVNSSEGVDVFVGKDSLPSLQIDVLVSPHPLIEEYSLECIWGGERKKIPFLDVDEGHRAVCSHEFAEEGDVGFGLQIVQNDEVVNRVVFSPDMVGVNMLDLNLRGSIELTPYEPGIRFCHVRLEWDAPESGDVKGYFIESSLPGSGQTDANSFLMERACGVQIDGGWPVDDDGVSLIPEGEIIVSAFDVNFEHMVSESISLESILRSVE